jgi:hypothetical protein
MWLGSQVCSHVGSCCVVVFLDEKTLCFPPVDLLLKEPWLDCGLIAA